jgi:hypothetical protein
MKKQRRKPKVSSGERAGRPRPPQDDRTQIIKELAAAGLSGDVIAATLKLGQNRLRREHALALHSGRTAKNEAAKAAAAAALNKEEAEQLERIKKAFASHWYSEEFGCDLYGGARTIAEAQAWCRQFKSAHKPNEDSNGQDDPV